MAQDSAVPAQIGGTAAVKAFRYLLQTQMEVVVATLAGRHSSRSHAEQA